MRLIGGLFVLTLGLTLSLKYIVTPRYGEDVQARFIERLNSIPSQASELLSRETLARWLADDRNESAIRGYVCPVLFPLDLLFLLSLGFLLALASTALAGTIGYIANWPLWLMWAFPVSYMVSDLAEDVLVALIFKSAIMLTDTSFGLLRTLTAIKLFTISIAIGQVGVLGGHYLFLRLFFPRG